MKKYRKNQKIFQNVKKLCPFCVHWSVTIITHYGGRDMGGEFFLLQLIAHFLVVGSTNVFAISVKALGVVAVLGLLITEVESRKDSTNRQNRDEF